MRKERFPEQWISKLMPQGYGLFHIIERINENAYKIDLPGKYGVDVTFNIFNIFLFDVGDDSRTNSFDDRRNDTTQATPRDLLEVLISLVTRLRTKRFKEILLIYFMFEKDLLMGFRHYNKIGIRRLKSVNFYLSLLFWS
jgi:hypothetical protein